jgi:hypothetical protein
MQKTRSSKWVWILVVLAGFPCARPAGQDVDAQHRKLFVKCEDKRSWFEQGMNWLGSTTQEVGRSFALVAGVSKYPQMSEDKKTLGPAAEDLKAMVAYLKGHEFFDEIVLLQDEDMTIDNLAYFLQWYFPERMKKFPRSRFLFAYSGHGMTEGTDGFILTGKTRSLSDKLNGISLQILKVFVDQTVQEAHYALVLINACYSGAFLGRQPITSGGARKSIPQGKGAHVITAGSSREVAWAYGSGRCSHFFEKAIEGIGGAADLIPKDNVVTSGELAAYIRSEVRTGSDEKQHPRYGDIRPGGSDGEFFFLNKDKPVSSAATGPAESGGAVSMGGNSQVGFWQGVAYYWKGDYSQSLRYLKDAAMGGNEQAMDWVGQFYQFGIGVDVNFEDAFKMYAAAADRGYANSMYRCGEFYERGLGVAKDYVRAYEYYEQAVTDAPDAKTAIGRLHENGLGVGQDMSEALRWYEQGAQSGSVDGMLSLGRVYRTGAGVRKDPRKSISWYNKAVDAGSKEALRILGKMYEDGDGVPRDEVQAYNYYLRGGATTRGLTLAASYGITHPSGSLGDRWKGGRGFDAWLGATGLMSESWMTTFALGFAHQGFESQTDGSSNSVSEIDIKISIIYYRSGAFKPLVAFGLGYGWIKEGPPKDGFSASLEAGGMVRLLPPISIVAAGRVGWMTQAYGERQTASHSSVRLGLSVDMGDVFNARRYE